MGDSSSLSNGGDDKIFEISKINTGKSGFTGKNVQVLAENADAVIKVTYFTAAPAGSIEITTSSGKKFNHSMTCKISN